MQKTIDRVRTKAQIIGRIALDLQREARARERTETARTLHRARAANADLNAARNIRDRAACKPASKLAIDDPGWNPGEMSRKATALECGWKLTSKHFCYFLIHESADTVSARTSN